MDPTPPGTISPGAVDGSYGSLSMYDSSSGVDDGSLYAFLALQFPDGQWFLRTKSVVLGRDEALKQTIEDRASLRARNHQGHAEAGQAINDAASDGSGSASEDEDQLGPRFKFSECGGFRSELPGETIKTDRGDEPFMAIHPPVDVDTGEMRRLTAISKKHARIEVRGDDAYIEVLGRNGLFLNGSHMREGAISKLQDGDEVSIAGLEFQTITDPSKSYVRDISDVDEISSDDEDDVLEVETSVGDAETATLADSHLSTHHPSEEPAGAKPIVKSPKSKASKPITLTALHKRQENDTEEDLRRRLQSILPPGETLERRKGPGRPPANGLMSKRQISELMKKRKLLAEGGAADVSMDSLKGSANADADDEGASKNKNKKRKRSDSAADSKNVDSERKKPEEPQRSPSPTEDQFTPEQLEKPDLTYALMIYKILSEVKPTQLNLQQLYKEVKQRWPFYRFKKDTTGWESSVRHTIKQNFFKQGERDGKGYKYTVNEQVDPPMQKTKPTPTQPQPANYAGAQYRPPQYSQYPNSSPYARPFNTQPYQYQMPNQRPGASGAPQQPLQYQGQYAQQPGVGARPQPAQPQAGSGAQQLSGASNIPSPGQAGGQAPSSAFGTAPSALPGQQYRPPTTVNGTAVTSSQPTAAAHAIANGHSQAQNANSPLVNASSGYQNAQSPAGHQRPNVPPTGILSSAPNTAQSPASFQGVPPRPASVAQSPGVPAGASQDHRPLPSEEIRNGQVPQVLTDFVNNMKRMCKNLPPSTVNESVRRAEDAIDWVMRNPQGDPKKELGKSHLWQHLVTLVQETIINHDKAERSRRGELASPAPNATAGSQGAASSSAPANAQAAAPAPDQAAKLPTSASPAPTQTSPAAEASPAPSAQPETADPSLAAETTPAPSAQAADQASPPSGI